MTEASDGRRPTWNDLERIVRANEYMVLATADATGAPWASPVWFATTDFREFFWVSDPQARHSRNLATRPELAIAIFDTTQKPGTGTGVYLSARGRRVEDDELDAGIAIFSAASQRVGLSAWSRADVDGSARLRLYRATAHEQFVLDSRDRRVSVSAP